MSKLKGAVKSKTMWANGLVAGLYALEMNIGMIEPFLGEKTGATFILGLTVVNAVLRVVTKEPLEDK